MADILAQILADPIVSSILVALGIGAVALWLVAAWWAFGDASIRTESTLVALGAAGWIVLSSPIMLPLALAIYRSVRPDLSAADVRSQRLAVALVESGVGATCPACAIRIQPAWRRCPGCATWLAVPCASCGTWSDPTFEICPRCGHESLGEPAVETGTVGAAAAAGIPALAGASAYWVGQQAAAAGGSPAAAGLTHADVGQRGVRIAASSARPSSYATSRDSLSAPS